MYSHRVTFEVEGKDTSPSVTIDLPCADLPDEVIEALASIIVDAFGPLVAQRADDFPAFLWERKSENDVEFQEIGGG